MMNEVGGMKQEDHWFILDLIRYRSLHMHVCMYSSVISGEINSIFYSVCELRRICGISFVPMTSFSVSI